MEIGQRCFTYIFWNNGCRVVYCIGIGIILKAILHSIAVFLNILNELYQSSFVFGLLSWLEKTIGDRN